MTQSPEVEAPLAAQSTDISDPIVADVPRSLGTQLREAREAGGHSIADVVQVIRFSAHQIQALERDDYASLPGATSVRGLVRNYAKFLRLDSTPLLALLEPAVPVPEADVRPPTNMGEAEQQTIAERFPPRLLAAAIGMIVLVAVGYWFWDMSGEGHSVPRAAVSTPSAPTGPAAQNSTVEPGTGSGVAVAAPAATIVGSTAPTASADPGGPAPAGGLRIEFDDRSWIEIRDATQKIVLVGEYSAGARHNVEGKPPFQLWIGRASGVRVFLGERAIDLKPHTREEVARFTLE